MSLLALGTAALNAGASYLSARQQQQAQMDLQANNQAWQERMSNTAHQREVADLQAAGLNPVLSAGGQGATTPSGGVGEAQMADMGNAINTAIQAKQTEAQIKNIEAQTQNINTNTAKQSAEITKNNAEIIKIAKENGYTDEKIKNAMIERAYLQSLANKAKSEKELIDAQTKIKKWEGRNPLLINLWAPMATAVAGGIAGGVSGGFMGGLMGGINSAKQHQYKMAEKGLQINSGGIDPRSLGIGL